MELTSIWKNILHYKSSLLFKFFRIGRNIFLKNIRMKILRLTRDVLAFIGYLSDEPIFRFKIIHTTISVLIAVILIAFGLTSSIYAVKHLQIGQYAESLYAVWEIVSMVQTLASFGTIMIHKNNIREVIDEFQKIFNNCNKWHACVEYSPQFTIKLLLIKSVGAGKSSAELFMRTDKFCEKILKYALTGFIGTFVAVSIILAATSYAFYYIRDGYADPTKLFLSSKMRHVVARYIFNFNYTYAFLNVIYLFWSLPFNRNSFCGWASTVCIEAFIGAVYSFVTISTTAFFMTIGFYFRTCAQPFRIFFANINRIVDELPTIERRIKIKKSFIEAVDFHNTTKRYEVSKFSIIHWNYNFFVFSLSICALTSDLLNGTIFSQLFLSIIYLSIVIFEFELVKFHFIIWFCLPWPIHWSQNYFHLQLSTHLDLNFLIMVFAATSGIATVFLYCYIGSLVTDHFQSYGDIPYEIQWYKLPIDLQKFLQLIIFDAQRPHIFHGLHIIDLNMMAFTQVNDSNKYPYFSNDTIFFCYR